MKSLEPSYLLAKRLNRIRSECERVFQEFPKGWNKRKIKLLVGIISHQPRYKTVRIIDEINKSIDNFDNPVEKMCNTCLKWIHCRESDPEKNKSCSEWVLHESLK